MTKSMKTMITGSLAAAVLATSFLAVPSVAQADSVTRADGSFDVAQNWNGYGHGNRGPGWNHRAAPRGPHWNRGSAWRGPGYYGGRYYDNSGAAVAAGVIGLATGAIIAGSMNNQRYANNYVEYCSQRYRTFNPNTGTYTGNDGRQHRCVAPN